MIKNSQNHFAIDLEQMKVDDTEKDFFIGGYLFIFQKRVVVLFDS